jgi:hypothetical protein
MTTSARASALWIAAAIFALTGCGGGGKTVITPTANVTVSPVRAAVVATTQTQQFTATVTGTVTDLTVSWSVDGTTGGSATVGTVSASGLYTPPATGGTHMVTATSNALSMASASASVAVTDLAGVFTYHNDLARDGVNSQEYALTSSTVVADTFGKLFSCPVDGAVYTQPLWVPGMSIAGGTHNVIFVATQKDNLYAFDADANPCVNYWHVSLIDSLHGGTHGETPVVWNDVGYCYGDVYPEVGVTGTPVIDPASNTIYVVTASEVPGVNTGNCALPQGAYYHRLHAIDLFTGSEKVNPPVTISASVPGTGDGSSGGMVSFRSQLQHDRSGLALSGGNVYVTFSAHEDATPYHGWVLGYNASTLQQVSVFNTTPNGIGGADGGIWGGGGAPAIDSGGNIFVATGNGVFDQSAAFSLENDYGDSVLRLQPLSGTTTTANGVNLKLVDFFTPDDQSCLAQGDTDLGSGAPVLLPDQMSAGVPTHLLAHVGKEGVVYLINRDSMGTFSGQAGLCTGSNNQIVQSFPGAGGIWGTPAFWQNSLYTGGAGNPLSQFSFDTATGLFNAAARTSQSTQHFNYTGTTPSVSSQGASSGIVWALDVSLYGYASPSAAGGINCYVSPVPAACSGSAILHAYSATNLQTEYWNST